MPLTDLQIESLFKFTQKKFVHYYDLQLELVDHLASSIEDEMVANPNLDFEYALQKVYNRFGIFGFAKVVQEKSAALHKNNWRIWRSAVKEFFTIPKIAFTIAIFFAAIFLGKYLPPNFKAIIIAVTWMCYAIYEIHNFKITRKINSKKLLLTEATSFSSGIGLIGPQIVIQISWASYHNNFVFATIFVLIIILESAVIKVNKTVRKKAMDLYPEAFVISS